MKTQTQSARFGGRSFAPKVQSSTRSSGFTLIEMMVAVALFAVLMIVVFVPLTQAARFLSVGRTRAGLQQSANQTISQLQRDLQRAIYVYPNDILPSVTKKEPYYSIVPTRDNQGFPYIQQGEPPVSRGVGNSSRIDILLPELDVNGNVKYPITPAKYMVTYYAARLNTTKPVDARNNPIANPVVLIRAQYPYLNRDGIPLDTIDTSNSRYDTTLTPPPANGWLTQGGAGLHPDEFDLSALCANDVVTPTTSPNPIVVASLAVVTPRNIALVTPVSAPPLTDNLRPNTSFNCADVNGDGKIDQVTVNLTITQFDRQITSGGNDINKNTGDNLNFQKFTLSQSINLPNIR
jgi:prepilin-type N-terminal cleavage/methylation domain-containing protein